MDVKYVVEHKEKPTTRHRSITHDLTSALKLKRLCGEEFHVRIINSRKVITWSDIIDHFNIGSEGGSAWCWRGDDVNDMRCIGFTGKTRKEALEKLLEAILDE